VVRIIERVAEAFQGGRMGLVSDLQEPAFLSERGPEPRNREFSVQDRRPPRTYYVRKETCLCIATCGVELTGGVIMWLLQEEERPRRTGLPSAESRDEA